MDNFQLQTISLVFVELERHHRPMSWTLWMCEVQMSAGHLYLTSDDDQVEALEKKMQEMLL